MCLVNIYVRVNLCSSLSICVCGSFQQMSVSRKDIWAGWLIWVSFLSACTCIFCSSICESALHMCLCVQTINVLSRIEIRGRGVDWPLLNTNLVNTFGKCASFFFPHLIGENNRKSISYKFHLQILEYGWIPLFDSPQKNAFYFSNFDFLSQTLYTGIF